MKACFVIINHVKDYLVLSENNEFKSKFIGMAAIFSFCVYYSLGMGSCKYPGYAGLLVIFCLGGGEAMILAVKNKVLANQATHMHFCSNGAYG